MGAVIFLAFNVIPILRRKERNLRNGGAEDISFLVAPLLGMTYQYNSASQRNQLAIILMYICPALEA